MAVARRFYEVQRPSCSRARGSCIFVTAAELNGLLEKWKFSQGYELALLKLEAMDKRTKRSTTSAAFLHGQYRAPKMALD